MKLCTKCQEWKQLEDFHFKNKKKGTRRDWCKFCTSAYHRQHYLANKESYVAHAQQSRQRLKDWVTSKKSVPCTDCDVSYPPYVMHFDHLPGSNKLGNVSVLTARCSSRPIVESEIAKCEVVCANCHAIRTYKRLHEEAD